MTGSRSYTILNVDRNVSERDVMTRTAKAAFETRGAMRAVR